MKNMRQSKILLEKRYRKQLILLCLVGLFAIWNIPNTIAARYIFESILVLILLTYKINWIDYLKKLKLLVIFFIYLSFQILLFSSNLEIALKNFKSEWMHFIIFSLIGVGAGHALRNFNYEKNLLYLGFACIVPILIHLALLFFEIVNSHRSPWGYLGIHENHGDLGYASLQGSIFFITFLICQAKSKIQKLIALFAISICIISTLIAVSRGGLVFTLIVIGLALLIPIIFPKKSSSSHVKIILSFTFLILISVITIKLSSQNELGRWSNLSSRIEIGLSGNIIPLYCNGINQVNVFGKSSDQSNKIEIESLSGDSLRIMALRISPYLVMGNIMGINNSKHAYQEAIVQICENPPAVFLSHAHNAWVDTALSIGLAGSLILLIYYIYLVIISAKILATLDKCSPYAFALFLSSLIWLIRGIADSTLRDQMLEMQALVLPFLFIMSQKNACKINRK